MTSERPMLVLAGALIALTSGVADATTREVAELAPARLTFGQSVLNQLTHDTYRDPFDELQTRPYNLLFANIGRHANLSPWEGQAGNYTRYLNALIGNNGAANVDNDADAIQGSLIRRETDALAWGVSAAFLTGNEGSDDANGATTFTDADDLHGYELRTAGAWQMSERRVLGAGIHVTQAGSEVTEDSFEPGVGGFFGAKTFDQLRTTLDFGMRQFQTPTASWEARVLVGFGDAEQEEWSDDVDAGGNVTERFVITNYDISDFSLGIEGGYNRLRPRGLGETQYRIGIERTARELGNADLSFREDGTGVTPSLTLLGQDTIAATRLRLTAQTIFPAGETEVFTGGELGYASLTGATEVDAAGTVVHEDIDDSQLHLGLTVGVRQPLFRDKLRFIVSGRADLVDQEQRTTFDTGADGEDAARSTAQYAIGLEGVLANVTFDVAWLAGDEAAVVPVAIGLPSGSRRTVELDRLVFSAAVAW